MYIEKEDRTEDRYEHVFENLDGSEWIGMIFGGNYDEACSFLNTRSFPVNKGRYPYKKETPMDMDKPVMMKKTRCYKAYGII